MYRDQFREFVCESWHLKGSDSPSPSLRKQPTFYGDTTLRSSSCYLRLPKTADEENFHNDELT